VDLFRELRRRKVIDTTIAYVLAAGVITHLTHVLASHGYFSPRISQIVLIAAIVALPLVIGLAWIFDITNRGFEITGPDAESSKVAVSWKRIALPITVSILLLIAILSFLSLNAAS
jgi:hypothetical protein